MFLVSLVLQMQIFFHGRCITFNSNYQCSVFFVTLTSDKLPVVAVRDYNYLIRLSEVWF